MEQWTKQLGLTFLAQNEKGNGWYLDNLIGNFLFMANAVTKPALDDWYLNLFLLAAKNPHKEDLHHAIGNVFGLHVDRLYPRFYQLRNGELLSAFNEGLAQAKTWHPEVALLLTPACAKGLAESSDDQKQPL